MGPEESMQIQSHLASTIAMAFDECVETAIELEEQGYKDVQIRNDDKAKFYPLLWMRGRDG